jgi:hypothetical protein
MAHEMPDKYLKIGASYVVFEDLTAVAMNNIVFWDVISCRLVEVLQRFGGM